MEKMAQAYTNRGIVKHKLEDLKGAISDYDMSIKLDPDIAVAWLNRGIAKEALKSPDAENDFAVAAQLDPQFCQIQETPQRRAGKGKRPSFIRICSPSA